MNHTTNNPPPKYRKQLFGDTLAYKDDYRCDVEVDEQGKTHRHYTYIGNLFAVENREKARLLFVCAAVLTVFLAVSLLCLQMTACDVSGFAPVLILRAASLFACLYAVMGAFLLPFSGKTMPRDRYLHSVIRSCRSCLAIAVFCFAAIVCGLCFRWKNSLWMFASGDVRDLVLTAAGLILSVVILILLQTVDIQEIPNPEPQESSDR